MRGNSESSTGSVRKEEIIEDLNRKLRRGKMDEAETKADDDNCSHASTLSSMSSSSTGSSILSNKLNNSHEKYDGSGRSKNLKNDSKSK